MALWRYSVQLRRSEETLREIGLEYPAGIMYPIWPANLRIPQDELEDIARERDVWVA